jgi:hypothetical protein
MRHVDHLPGRVEPPLEVDERLRVGHHLARDPGRFFAGDTKHLNLVRLAVRRNCKVIIYFYSSIFQDHFLERLPGPDWKANTGSNDFTVPILVICANNW